MPGPVVARPGGTGLPRHRRIHPGQVPRTAGHPALRAQGRAAAIRGGPPRAGREVLRDHGHHGAAHPHPAAGGGRHLEHRLGGRGVAAVAGGGRPSGDPAALRHRPGRRPDRRGVRVPGPSSHTRLPLRHRGLGLGTHRGDVGDLPPHRALPGTGRGPPVHPAAGRARPARRDVRAGTPVDAAGRGEHRALPAEPGGVVAGCIDAAYGGPALFSPHLAHLLRGAERADSVSFDLHKLGWIPASSSVLLLRDSAAQHPDRPASVLRQPGR
ncbi:pyridoxal-dependent decarboxylase [Streptomyces sp. NPDC001793]|uniref:pyridoxal-dependent decarboxylase n=1 Tax=Streptomyces sp. NPDC001793 TaxID=3154657 RepID=UPI00332ABFD9